MDKNTFRQLLIESFPTTPVPFSPYRDDVLSGFGDEDGVPEMRIAIEGKPWPDIDLLYGSRNCLQLAFTFLKGTAKSYYLPGFMMAFLDEDVRDHNGVLWDSFIRNIDPRRTGDDVFIDFILNLDRHRSSLVACCLLEFDHIEPNSDAAASLEEYWNIFVKDIPEELLDPSHHD